MIYDDKLHVNDTNTELRFQLDPDNKWDFAADPITAAKLKIRYPDGSQVIKDAAADGSEVIYKTQPGDLSQAGTYYFQPLITTQSGWAGSGEIVKDIVYY